MHSLWQPLPDPPASASPSVTEEVPAVLRGWLAWSPAAPLDLPGPETLLDTLGREAFPGWLLSTSPTQPEPDPTSKPPSLIPVPAAQRALLAPGALNAQGNPGRGTGRQCHDQPRAAAAPPIPAFDPLVALGLKVPGPTSGEGGATCLGVQPLSLRGSSRRALFVGALDPPVTSRRGTRLWARGPVAAVSGPLGLPCLLLLKVSGSRIQG